MRDAVVTDQTGAIHSQNDMQPHEADILNQHIVRALEKGRIHGKNGRQPLLCHTCTHSGGMLLGNAELKITLGKTPGKFGKTRSLLHCRGNSADGWILFRQRDHRSTKGS